MTQLSESKNAIRGGLVPQGRKSGSSKTFTSLSRAVTLFALGGVIAFTSACGSADAKNDSDSSSNASASISQAATPESSASPSPSVEAPAGKIPAGFGKPAPSGKAISSPNGSYIQSTISDDDAAMKLNPGLVDSSLAAYDPAEIEAALRSIVKFTAEEGIDSRLNGDNNDVDQWWEENKGKIDPAYHGEIYEAVKDGKAFILNEKWQAEYNGKYDYLTESDKTRIYDREINPTIIWALDANTIAVEMNVSYKIPAKPGVGKTGSGVQASNGMMTYSVSKDPATGQWLINGYDHDMDTFEG